MTKRGWWIIGVVAVSRVGHSARVALVVHHDPRRCPRALVNGRPGGDPSADAAGSVLIAPIVFDLGPAIAQFEADVPRHFGSMDRRIRADSSSRASVAFAASRSPFQVRVDGTEIVVETVLEYEGRGWYDPPLAPEVSAGCGGGDDPKPRLRVRVVSTPSLTPEWGLRTHTRADVTRFSDEPRDQCQVTLLKIDVTGRVVDAVRERMTRGGGALRSAHRATRHARSDRAHLERRWNDRSGSPTVCGCWSSPARRSWRRSAAAATASSPSCASRRGRRSSPGCGRRTAPS